MKKFKQIIIVALLLVSFTLSGQSKPGETGVYALTNATVKTVTNGTIENGTVVIADGKIAAVGTSVTIPEGAEVIDCSGKMIYPGLIDGGTRLGLSEVGSVSLTQDYSEVGEVVPQMQALTAVNPNSALIPVTRVSGVTTALAVPSGGFFPGTAALIDLYGYTPDQMFAGFKGVVMNFPTTGRRGWWDRRSDEEIKKEVEKTKKEIARVWQKVISYSKIDSATEGEAGYYPEMEALIPVVRGEMPVLIEVNAANDIKEAIKWVEENEVNAVFTGVAEGWRVADEIAKANISVITGPVLNLPTRSYDSYARAYENPGLMKKAGVKVAIRTNETENVRNLPFNAGFAAAYGMGKDEALRAVTIVPAEIFGIADKTGSIEVGKTANVVITDGDIFETSTNIEQVFINGWKIPMESRHTELYEEFLQRSPGLSK